MDCGIVGFEEVFHSETLKRAVDASGCFKGGEIISHGTGSGPTVALATTLLVESFKFISDFPKEAILNFEGLGHLPITKFSRPVLRAVLRLPTGLPVTVFVMHLKSKRPVVSPEGRHDPKLKAIGHALSLITRAAEAAALRCILIDEMNENDRPVIVIGDLNDVVHCVTTEILAGTPPWKNIPRSEKDKVWDTLLWSTNDVQVRASDRDVTYTHIHNGRYEVLDHILVSQEFVRSNPKHIGYVQHIQIFNDHLIDATLSDEYQDLTQSDHGQVVAVIKLYAGGPKVKTERDG